MTEKSILLALGDPQALVDVKQALGVQWETTSVSSEADAFAQLEKRSFDALLVDFNLGSPDGSELLNKTLEKRPEIRRFLLAFEADVALVAAKVLGPHRVLPKPIDLVSLKSRIEAGLVPEDQNAEQSESLPLDGESASLTIPPVYREVLKALESPGVTNEQVAEIIAGDLALMAELLGLTHSAYLGVPTNVTDPGKAVGLLGLGAVKGLVMAKQFLAEHSKLNPGYLSLDQIWEHSVNVGRVARDLVLFETKDRILASEALTAGLLHDLGKVVLVLNFDDLYGRVHSLARKQPVPLWDIEKEIFGASHGEIGGCLAGMWNLPNSIVEATAFHHEPPLGEHKHLTALAAVHIADVLEHEIRASGEGFVAPRINTALLTELGLLQRLPVWRAAVPNWGAAKPVVNVVSAETQRESILQSSSAPLATRSANELPGATAATQTATSGQPEKQARKPAVLAARYWQRGKVFAGVAAGVLMLLALWVLTQPEVNTTEPVYARTPAPEQALTGAPVVVPPAPLPDTPPEAVPELAATMAVSEEAPVEDVSSEMVSEPVVSLPESEPTSAVSPQPAVAEVSSPALPAKEKAQPDFRLYGVIYTTVRPSAIVNGETVCVGDRVGGATVVGIGRTNVTLQVNGQQKTYCLR